MTNIILTSKQEKAIERVCKWFKVAKEDPRYQVFKIQGYAGTGKSTIVSSAIEALGLQKDDVAFATFTGKAASVLCQKGCMATTIHKLIYDTVMNKDGSFSHYLKDSIDKELIVIDEISMVNLKLWTELASFGLPIITLGDPGQLPPVGDDNGLMSTCHVFLDEIHRQAAENPIIKLSMMARNGETIPYGKYGDNVIVIPRNKLSEKSLLAADQIICGYNKTKDALNQQMRQVLGLSGEPTAGDKMMCLANMWGLISDGYPMVNGTIGYVENITSDKKMLFRPNFTGTPYDAFEYKLGQCIDKKDFGKVPMNYSYAITCHKSQGSEFDKLIVIEEHLKGDHSKWLYTAITRASEKLILVR